METPNPYVPEDMDVVAMNELADRRLEATIEAQARAGKKYDPIFIEKMLTNAAEARRREGRREVSVDKFDTFDSDTGRPSFKRLTIPLDPNGKKLLDVDLVDPAEFVDPISYYLNTGEGLGEALDAIGDMLEQRPRLARRTVGAIANGKPLPKPGPRKLQGVTPDVVIVDEVQVEEDPFAGRMTTRSFQDSMELRALQGKLHAEERRKLERGKGNRGARRIDPKARRQK